jgi:hypothetical protein
LALPPIYKIHPAIGIARLGDAATFFIGPETPGLRPIGDPPGTRVPPYKDGGKIKPQAARFRIFEYVDKGGQYTVNREISLTEKDVTKLVWTAHLANRKASFFKFDGLAGEGRPPTKGHRNPGIDPARLDIDPRERTITGRNAKAVEFRRGTSKNPSSERWPNPDPSPKIDTLGTLLTDADGRLIVLGGKGIAGSQPGATPINHYSNNDGWFDDVSDGPVSAYLEIKGKPVHVAPAWVLCPPPDFAPHLTSVVTLYDVLYDVAARSLTLPTNESVYRTGALAPLLAINQEFKKAGKAVLSSYQPDFNTEIYPILYRAASAMYLFGQAVGQHTTIVKWPQLASRDKADQPARQGVFTFVRDPDALPSNSFPYMPKLLGDEPYPLAGGVIHKRVRLTVTPTQFAILSQWVKGDFVQPAVVPPKPPTAQAITPEGLDRAALENCVGGAFFPGIEVGWQVRAPSLYTEPVSLHTEPFRVAAGVKSAYLGDTSTVRAGYFTRQMALPWQADFLQCKSEDDASGAFPGLRRWGWWPMQRPDGVFSSEADYRAKPPKSSDWHRATKGGTTSPWAVGFNGDTSTPSYVEMIDNWRKFGFVVEAKPTVFVETEREADIP